jgi:hypothetical protein
MVRFLLPLLCLCTAALGAQTPGDRWTSVLGRVDGTFVTQTFRVTRTPAGPGWVFETVAPAAGTVSSLVRVEVDADLALVRSRTDYRDPQLAEWYRADFLLTEAQPAEKNLAFQRVWKNQVQEAKNLVWGSDFVEFSTLPFVLERRVTRGDLGPFRFRTYSGDTPGTMEVTFQATDRPLDVEKRYRYPRYLRDRFGTRPVILAALHAVGDFQGGYPFPFFYAFDRTTGAWVAAWGGSPQETTFQWRE